MQEDTVMKYETVLPENFDGVFRFTNDSDEDFTAKWGGKEYHFPAHSTCPMIMPDHSPLEIQQIRKKFAKDFAEQQFFKSQKYRALKSQETNPDGSPRLNSILQAGTYSMDDLAPIIQRCLTPLPEAKAEVRQMEMVKTEDKLTRNEDGEFNTSVVDRKTSLRKKALDA